MAYNDYIIKTLCRCFEKDELDQFTNCALVFAYNGTGKTRLSYDFAHYGRKEGDPQHTLYYNAYTEDLFTWDNDLENNTDYKLMINQDSSLIQGLAGYEFSNDLRKYLQMLVDIDFEFHYDENNENIPDYVEFSKKKSNDKIINKIKISRGEERLFVWCFFRCIMDQVLGGNDAYKDIHYIYIDDPMSSLDDNNVIAFAAQLYSVIREQKDINSRFKFIVSSHHALFFHVMDHGLNADKKLGRYYLSRDKQSNRLVLKYMDRNSTPFYYNVAVMCEIQKAIETDRLYTYHFTILRSVMEKIKEFFGHRDYAIILDGIKYMGTEFNEYDYRKGELEDLYSRFVNVFSHQGSFFAPDIMTPDNKRMLIALFEHLVNTYRFELPHLDDYHNEGKLRKNSKKIE